MTGPSHYARAERVLAQVEDHDVSAAMVAAFTAVAQVHATLALAAATADGSLMAVTVHAEWDRAIGHLEDGPEVTR